MNPRAIGISLSWRFTLAIAFQLAIVLSIPAPKAITIATGNSIYLATRPVDPYDILRGRYVTLEYAVEQSSEIADLPGYLSKEQLEETYGELPDRIYLIMEKRAIETGERDSNATTRAVSAWDAVRVAYRLPQDLDKHQQILASKLSFHSSRVWIDAGLGQYFIPEAIGDALEEDIRQHQEATLAEVKVDRRGNAALVGVWVEDREY
ncbi:MAG: GDYXXLXY domain-containing protein [Synechococcus sp.]